MSDKKCIWISEYTEADIDPFSRMLDLGLPIPYGFVIPRLLLHSVFLDLKVQQKLVPLFEFVQEQSPTEIVHAQKLIEQTIRRVKIPNKFSTMIQKSYESLQEKERDYLKMHTNDLHRAIHILKHVYTPYSVKLSVLPHTDPSLICCGEQSLVHSVSMLVTQYLAKSITHERSIKLPSILVQRATNGQFSGYCETINSVHNNHNQIIISANYGALLLDESPDIYLIEKDGTHIQSRHLLTQPYKYVLKGSEYKKIHLNEEEGERQVLTDSYILKIAFMAKDIEKRLYFPQKIYWTIENGNLYITKLKSI
jgi:phosphoenolpyruvate synthase/pyruvate phosphate dikinase